MKDTEFWSVIAAARSVAGDDGEARAMALRHALGQLTPEQIQLFQAQYDGMIRRAYRWDLWAAAYLMNSGCSDHGFRCFCDWLISEGVDTYERALADPDSLASLPTSEVFQLESFGNAAFEVFKTRNAGELARKSQSDFGKPKGKEWGEDELPSLLPHLWGIYLA